jgi:hypothetical protein
VTGRLLAVARDEWPALRWRVHVSPDFVRLRGRDRRGHRVVDAFRWYGRGPWSAWIFDDIDSVNVAGRTLRAAVRAARYAMEAP